MITDSDKDLIASHGVVNYLNAGYQGAFAGLNMLAQLQASSFYEDDLVHVRQSLEKVTAWVNDLWKANCLFCDSWTKPETFPAQKALSVLSDLRPDIAQTRNNIITILKNPQWPSDPESVKYLVAAFGRYVYSRDNYIRGFVEFGKIFNQPNMVSGYSDLLVAASEDVKTAHEFLNSLKSSIQQPQQFYEALYYQAVRLPAVFATHIHDIAQLVAKYGAPLTFRSIGIDDISAEQWQQLGMGPQAAGYWLAHEIEPDEAATWLEADLKEAAAANEWRLLGFNPQSAAPWHNENFPAIVAAAWASAGFTPEKSVELMKKGYQHPSMIPK